MATLITTNVNGTLTTTGTITSGGSFVLPGGFTMSHPGSGYAQFSSWVLVNGHYGIYSGTNGAHIYPNNGSYGSWRMDGSRNSYQGIEFGSGSNGAVCLMVHTNSNITGFHNTSYDWQFYWSSGTLYCFKNSYGGGTQATVLDSSNFGTWAAAASHTHSISDVINLAGQLNSKLGVSDKAADSELIDGIDSSRIVYGDGDKKSTNFSDMNAYNQSSGFFFYNQPTGNPFGDWTNWINVMGNSWNNNYGFQIAHAFHNDGFAVRRVTNGSFASWRTIIDSGNIGSQSVNYATSAGSATSSTSASYASGLSRYGIIYGNNWNTYNVNGQFIVASAHNFTGTNKPDTAYNYGSTISYYNSGEDHYQIYITENSVNSNGKDRKMYYRSGWNNSWGGWRSVVDVYNSVCYIDAAVTATGDITAFSDARVKENVETLEGALGKTLKLRGVSYNRTDIEDKSKKIGVIAQEILEVVPEVVSQDENGMYAVSYGNITALLIEAIKEQQKQIDKLKEIIDGLTK